MGICSGLDISLGIFQNETGMVTFPSLHLFCSLVNFVVMSEKHYWCPGLFRWSAFYHADCFRYPDHMHTEVKQVLFVVPVVGTYNSTPDLYSFLDLLFQLPILWNVGWDIVVLYCEGGCFLFVWGFVYVFIWKDWWKPVEVGAVVCQIRVWSSSMLFRFV
jgi:hypothetical protein